MKKIILTATMALCSVGLFAQSSGSGSSGLMSKKGEMILPEAGDWAISFDATPFLNYFGRFLSNAGATSPTAGFLNPASQTIVGKYYVDAQTAYRGVVRIGFNSNTMTHMTMQDVTVAQNPPYSTVTDQLKVSNHFIGLGAGMEKRKGKTRLQGYYGAELMFWLAASGDSTMTYGNPYDATNFPSPNSYNWATGVEGAMGPGGRTISDKPGSMFGVSVQGFIGFEYFFMPKISVGAEYTWGINFWSQGQGTTKTEVVYTDVNSGNPVDATISNKTGKSSHFGVDTGVNSMFGNSNSGAANLNIIFHF